MTERPIDPDRLRSASYRGVPFFIAADENPVEVDVDVGLQVRHGAVLGSRLRKSDFGKSRSVVLAEYVEGILAERDELADAYSRAPNYRWQAGFWRIVAAVETVILAGIAIALWASRS